MIIDNSKENKEIGAVIILKAAERRNTTYNVVRKEIKNELEQWWRSSTLGKGLRQIFKSKPSPEVLLVGMAIYAECKSQDEIAS